MVQICFLTVIGLISISFCLAGRLAPTEIDSRDGQLLKKLIKSNRGKRSPQYPQNYADYYANYPDYSDYDYGSPNLARCGGGGRGRGFRNGTRTTSTSTSTSRTTTTTTNRFTIPTFPPFDVRARGQFPDYQQDQQGQDYPQPGTGQGQGVVFQ